MLCGIHDNSLTKIVSATIPNITYETFNACKDEIMQENTTKLLTIIMVFKMKQENEQDLEDLFMCPNFLGKFYDKNSV